jgi:hypothetical protein
LQEAHGRSALTDTQIQAVMQAAAPLDPDKRLVFWSG